MNEINHTERDHAKLAPSSMKMMMECLASIQPLEIPVPEVVSAYAEEGTRAHELLEQCLRDPKRKALDKCEDKEMRDHIKLGLEYLDKLIAGIGKEQIHSILIEDRVKYSEHIYGTLDVCILYIRKGERRMYVFDLKYGKGLPVPAENNAQLLTYAVAAAKTHSWEPARATIAIYQPRNSEESDTPLDQWVTDLKTLRAWDRKLKSLEKKALKVLNGESKPKAVAGDHCRFCKRKAVCPAYKKLATADGLIVLDKAAPLPMEPKTKAPLKPEQLSDDQLSTILLNADAIRDFLKSVEEYAAKRYFAKQPVPGWKLVEGRSTRRWLENEEEIAAGLKSLGVGDPWAKKLRGITEIEKEIGKGKLNAFVRKPPGKPKLVVEADPRPALSNDATELLTTLVDEDDI